MLYWFVAYDIDTKLEGAVAARKSLEEALEGFEKTSGSVRSLKADASSRAKVDGVIAVFRQQRRFVDKFDLVLGVRRSREEIPEILDGKSLINGIVNLNMVDGLVKELLAELTHDEVHAAHRADED